MEIQADQPIRNEHLRPDRATDLVFDFSRMQQPDLAGLVLVLTARRVAALDDRVVWARSMSDGTWELLEGLGLADRFVPVPDPTPDTH